MMGFCPFVGYQVRGVSMFSVWSRSKKKISENQVRLKAHGASDIGLVRSNNEDCWYSSPQEALFVIADGLGGHQSGEVASKEAVELFVKRYRERIAFSGQQERARLFDDIAVATNRAVYEMSCSHDLLRGMGTTFTALSFHGETLTICHIGDSRTYRFSSGDRRLQQLTTDHLVLEPRHPRWEASREVGGYKGYLTRALGTQPQVMPEIITYPVREGDQFLMCTDGLSDMISNEVIQETLSLPMTIEQKVRTLIHLAKKQGGVDNITVILIEVLSENKEKTP